MKKSKTNLENIKKLLPFSDRECGYFQNFLFDYINNHELTKEDAFLIGAYGTHIQFSMRTLRQLILGDNNIPKEDVELLLSVNDMFNKHEDLVPHLIDMFKGVYERADYKTQYQYQCDDSIMGRVFLSYFSKTEEEILESEKEIYKINI